MSKVYILNTHIAFSPEKSQLAARDTDELVIKLNKPVSRCLELLIERRFSTVPQQDFYRYVWGDDGDKVSAMMLYQCIGLLRKALKSFKVGGGDKMINTVPKQGFSLYPDVKVQVLESENAGEHVVSSPIIKAMEESVTVELPLSSPSTLMPLNNTHQARPWRHFIIPAVIVMLLLGGILIQQIMWRTPSSSFTLSTFVKKGTVSGCQLYVNDDNAGISAFEKSTEAKQLDCKATPYAYLTRYQYGSQSSIVACERPLEGLVSPDCITYIVIEGEE